VVIKGKRIRSLDSYLAHLPKGSGAVFGLADIERFKSLLTQSGFTTDMNPGESVLPPSTFGPASRANSELRIQQHPEKPKVLVTHLSRIIRRQNGKLIQSKLFNREYPRRARTEKPPFAFELQIQLATSGEKIITLPQLQLDKDNREAVLHQVNLLLEIFGECHVFGEDLKEMVQVEIKHLNWELLPPGEYPWKTLQAKLETTLQKTKGRRVVVENRLETIINFGPTFRASGRAGFEGYLVFGFPNKKLFVLESLFFGRATYVLGENWEQISKLTKKEILDQDLHKARIVHQEGWHKEMHNLLSN
jgi:hypothetical protein